jgi:hypothetical protein
MEYQEIRYNLVWWIDFFRRNPKMIVENKINFFPLTPSAEIENICADNNIGHSEN